MAGTCRQSLLLLLTSSWFTTKAKAATVHRKANKTDLDAENATIKNLALVLLYLGQGAIKNFETAQRLTSIRNQGMQISITHLMEKALPAYVGRLPKDPVKYSPSDLRHGIQELVNANEMPLAQALADAGLALHPHSEDLLAISGLLALTQQNWAEAAQLLEELLSVQGVKAPAMTYKMLVRAQRCNLDLARAQRILAQGLAQWPQDPTLIKEQDDFLDGPAVMPSPELTN